MVEPKIPIHSGAARQSFESVKQLGVRGKLGLRRSSICGNTLNVKDLPGHRVRWAWTNKGERF